MLSCRHCTYTPVAEGVEYGNRSIAWDCISVGIRDGNEFSVFIVGNGGAVNGRQQISPIAVFVGIGLGYGGCFIYFTGGIDECNYEMLMKDIQAEQEVLEQKWSALQSKISQQHNTEMSVEQFRETVRECLNVTELTPFIPNKLISKIEISSLEIVDGEKQQVVSVEWKFALNS